MSAAASMPSCASGKVPDDSAIRQHASDISAHAAWLEILLLEALDKLGGITRRDDATCGAVECFITCALRNGLLMREAADRIAALVVEGGDA